MKLDDVDNGYIYENGDPGIEGIFWESASVAKLGRCDNIQTDVLLRICEAPVCTIEDILETIKE